MYTPCRQRGFRRRHRELGLDKMLSRSEWAARQSVLVAAGPEVVEARCEWRGCGAWAPARARHIRQGRSYPAPTRQLQNAVAKFVMILAQASRERPTCASCESATVGSVTLLSSPCYWLVPLMRRLTLAAEGSSRGGSSLQSEPWRCCLCGRAAITACCQLQLVPSLISLSSLLVVSCSSSENRSCVCSPALSCRIPHHHSNTAIAASSAVLFNLLHSSQGRERTCPLCAVKLQYTAVRCHVLFPRLSTASLPVWTLDAGR